MSVPWRVAAQAYTVLNPETKEPLITLQFISDHQQADVARLRLVPAREGQEGATALELEFATGGYPTGPAWLQPRWLKAFERPKPVNAEQRVALAKRRETWMQNVDVNADENDAADGSYVFREPSEADYAAWEAIHEPKDKDGNPVEKERRVGPDGVADGEDRDAPQVDDEGHPAGRQQKDGYVPDGAVQRQSGVDNQSPSPEDQKGMVGQGPGSEVPRGAGAQPAYNPSPGITPAAGQGAAPMTGGPGPTPGTVPPGGPYASGVDATEPKKQK